ncbi:MAG: T9SS type A sorting domain-containing protein [Bacteroidia bacterium]|nr:T9SS type A sorting domain-containing protein [Bacteroidia bacterium]
MKVAANWKLYKYSLVFIINSLAVESFAKLKTPVIFKPVNNTTNAPTGLQLEVETESVTTYAFEYGTDAALKNASRVDVPVTAYYTRLWVNKLRRNTKYYWRVKAISKTDSSDWTSINNFTTTAALKRYYPQQNAKVNSSFLYLSWYRAAGYDSFELQIDTSSRFNSKDIRKIIVPDTFKSFYLEYTQKNLTYGGTYYWRVRGMPETSPVWTDTGSFKIFDTITPKYPTTAFLQNVKISFEFTGVYFKEAFQVQIDTSKAFNSPTLIDAFALEGTKQFDADPFSIGNLKYDTYYHYRVRAINENDSSPWSYSAFKTKGFNNDFVIAENYADPMVSIEVRTKIEGTESYEIQLDTSTQFNSPEKQVFFSKSGIDTAYDLFFGKIYYARARPVHAKDSGSWTRTRIINILKFPNTQYPYTSSIVQITDSIQFATRKGMDGFQIQVNDQNQFDSKLFLDTVITNFKALSSHNIKGLRFKFNTTYFWRIRAWHDRDTSVWSTPTYFNTVKAPTLLKPFNSNFLGTGAKTTFTWSPLKGGVKYRFLLDTSMNFNSSELLDTVVNSTEFVKFNMLFRPLYYWKVQAFTQNDTSEWSETWKCKVLPVKLNIPRNNLTNVSLNSLDWNSIEGTTGYILELDTLSTFLKPFRVQDTQTNSFFHYFNQIPDIVGFNTKCYWRVKLFHETDTSDWSDVWNFTTKPRMAPTLTSPLNQAENQKIFNQLKWQAYSGASSYAVHYGDKADFSNAVKTTSTGTTLNVTLKPNTQYYWRVRGRNSSGAEFYDFSEVWTFTTDSGIPAPTLISPANNALNQTLNVSFSWGKFTPSTQYRIEISKDPSFNSGVVIKNTTTNTASFTHLVGNTTYYWHVKTYNGTAESEWSQAWKFTTEKVNSTELIVQDELRLYPNPSNGQIHLTSKSGRAEILSITDMQGREVQRLPSGENPVVYADLTSLSPGMYQVLIKTPNGMVTMKMVKE